MTRLLSFVAMAIEIRPVETDAEAERHGFISAYAFNGDRRPEAMELRAHYYPRDWCLAAFDGGEMVAGLVIMPFTQYMHGATIELGGIASVSCLPERRRGGFVGALLQNALARMRDAGQPLSGLYTPHYSLYRKYGYELANRIMSYTFPPKAMHTRVPAPAGTWRRVDAESWSDLDQIHQQFYGIRNGGLTRTEQRWRQQVFTDYGSRPRDAAIWSNHDGVARGYVVYQAINRPPAGAGFGETILRVADWVALDAEAYSAILNYLMGHDLSSRIIILAGSDEPFLDAFDEPTHIVDPPGSWPGMMLRLVDVQRAIEARPAMPHVQVSADVGVTDEKAPWNAGTWRISCSEGRMSAERTSQAADVEIDVRALASIYNGFTQPIDAMRVGTLRSRSAESVNALGEMFATRFAPYCPDDF